MRRRRPIPGHIRTAVYARDGAACAFCGTTSDLHLDHIVPWSQGGEDASWNLRPLCAHCNISRGTRHTPDDHQTRAPIGLSCTACAPGRPASMWGYCLACSTYGDVSLVDSCPDPRADGCHDRRYYARRAHRRKRRARR